MLSQFLLTIFCAFFSSSAKCLAPTPIAAPVIPPTPPAINKSPVERYSALTYLNTTSGKNTYRILVQNPLPSDGFQVHLKLETAGNITLTKTLVPGLNTLTSRTADNQIWLAAITKNPNTPWSTTAPVEVGRFSFTGIANTMVSITLGSSSAVLQHKSPTTANLLDSGAAKVTIERVTK